MKIAASVLAAGSGGGTHLPGWTLIPFFLILACIAIFLIAQRMSGK